LHGKATIAKLRLTMPPGALAGFALALAKSGPLKIVKIAK
jgi:hypothetical protein